MGSRPPRECLTCATALTVAKVRADPVGEAERGRSPRGEASPWCRDLPRWPSTNSVGIGGFTSVDSDVVPALFKERVDRYTLAVLK